MWLTKLKRTTMQKSKSVQMTLKGSDAESVCRVNSRLDQSGGGVEGVGGLNSSQAEPNPPLWSSVILVLHDKPPIEVKTTVSKILRSYSTSWIAKILTN